MQVVAATGVHAAVPQVVAGPSKINQGLTLYVQVRHEFIRLRGEGADFRELAATFFLYYLLLVLLLNSSARSGFGRPATGKNAGQDHRVLQHGG